METNETPYLNNTVQIPFRDPTHLNYRPTMTSACWLFLICFGLVIIVGGLLQDLLPGWGLILTEVLLILLPTLISIWIGKYPPKQTLQLYRPSPLVAILSLLAGVALRPVAIWIANVTNELLPFLTPGATDGQYTPLQTTLLLLGFVILAPICEEVLFRGYIQSAFSQRGAWFGIFMAGLLFALFHQSLISILALLPLAFITGYVAWRSNSLISAILLHLGYNGSLPLAQVAIPGLEIVHASLTIMVLALVVTLIALWQIQRTTTPVSISNSQAAFSPRWVFLITSIAVFTLFLLTSVLEILALIGKIP
jgi:membrane protease YdiL (CAAX protease family)